MTPRPNHRQRLRRAALGLAVVLVAPALLAGCDPRQALFFLQPFDPKIAAPCPSLKGKKVVVLAAAAPGATTEYVTVDREIAGELVKALRQNVKKITVEDLDKVREWQRSKPTLTDPAEAARAFDADVVVFLEIQKFQVQSPIDLQMYQGRANIRVQVTELKYPKDDRGHDQTDKPKESDVIHEGDCDIEFPVTGGIAADSGVSKATFKNKFMKVVNDRVSWEFIEHAPGQNIQDTRFHE